MGSTTNGEKDDVQTLNYFTCTLGQAAVIIDQKPHDFHSINEFIERQAKHIPHLAAVGFPVPRKEEEWGAHIFSFADLLRISIAAAGCLEEVLPWLPEGETGCVALLCPSSVDFLFAWLALMRMGYGVLLIAPQCQPAAIAHLCKSCDASHLLFDQSYEDLASKSASASSHSNLTAALLPWQKASDGISLLLHAQSPKEPQNSFRHASEYDIAYIHHTSGTSTGLPKPIPQTHRAGVGVLPCLPGSDQATFTTTPLYHGGVADCFRAWTSAALIWLFPGADVPITTSTILQSLSIAAETMHDGIPPVRYFSSVPYILQMMSEDEKGVENLRGMEIVGVGGAALPYSIGDTLVSRGINLVSRFGSAECGFLLSSHRNYTQDGAWQYLRAPANSSFLRFDIQPDAPELAELVVLKGWPHMAKTNRDDGSFATADLFEKHASLPWAWKYHSRKDALLTLVTGKKFDPEPSESAIETSSSVIEECLVFGNGRQIPGVLVFTSGEAHELGEGEVLEKVWKGIKRVNEGGQDHTRIAKDMVVVLPSGTVGLERSSKGTLMRGLAEKRFAREIGAAYNDEQGAVDSIEDGDVLHVVQKVVASVLEGNRLGDDDDFYHCGIDSAKCTQIRSILQKKVVGPEHALPFNVVYDAGTTSHLANFILQLRRGQSTTQDDGYQESLNLATQFSQPLSLPQTMAPTSQSAEHTVLLTGATGALGAHLLHNLHSNPKVARIICLVRTSSTTTASSRIDTSLGARQKPALGLSPKLLCLSSDPATPNLGLSTADFKKLVSSVTHIIHAAWPVNFSLPLRTFIPHLSFLQMLLSLTNSSLRPHLLFCSSTASMLNHPSPIPETPSDDPAHADALGYSKSKWVAERICEDFSRRGKHGARVSICRIGQLTGDSQNGVWNMSEAFPLLLSTVKPLNCLPNLPGEALSWLPVDVAALSILDIALAPIPKLHIEAEMQHEARIYHIVNNDAQTTWTDLLKWLGEMRGFDIVEPELWLGRLEALETHPAKSLLGLWRRAYCGHSGPRRQIVFETAGTEQVAPNMRGVVRVDQVLFVKIWKWLVERMAEGKV